jgi:NAD(P)-dependent dehydrogenase (short-subunit alcohol dehydrogenase family)
MEIRNCTALVTGANRAVGSAHVEALLAAGARKIYAGARDPATITNPRVIPLGLDITAPQQVAAAASVCADVPAQVAARTLAGIEAGHNHVSADAPAVRLREMGAEPERLDVLSQQLWDDQRAG